MIDSRAMIEMLRRHYIPDPRVPGSVFCTEITAPGPTGRRADLITLGATASTGVDLIGHEIKISRSDTLVELVDPTKSHSWQQYCDRWWLVVASPSIVDGLEVPHTWGIMAPPSGRRTRSMTIIRPAPRLDPAAQAPALRAIAQWQHWRLRDALAEGDRLRTDEHVLRTQVRHLEGLVPRAERTRAGSELETTVREIITGMGQVMTPFRADEATRIGSWQSSVPVSDVVAALTDLGLIRQRAESLMRDIEAAQSAAKLAAERASTVAKDRSLRAAAKRLGARAYADEPEPDAEAG